MSIFQFKQFSVNQQGCAMRINTDGVLLAAMAKAEPNSRILDIGTGTGVVALMLAQRFTQARIDAVEIDESAAKTASENAANSPFADRVNVWPVAFEDFKPSGTLDLIVSNPPFFIDALKNPDVRKQQARHTNLQFFRDLLAFSAAHLTDIGVLTLIIPPALAADVVLMGNQAGLHVHTRISISSFSDSPCIRQIISLSKQASMKITQSGFVIYASKGVYSDAYRKVLQPFFLAF